MTGTPADENQRQRLKNNSAPSELFVQRWSNRPATPSLSTQQPSDHGARSGDALFVPLGRDPMRLSANIPSRHLEQNRLVLAGAARVQTGSQDRGPSRAECA